MSRDQVREFFAAFDVPLWDRVRELLKEHPALSHKTDDHEDYYGWPGLHRLVSKTHEDEGYNAETIHELVTLFRIQELRLEPIPDISVVNLQTPEIDGEELYGYSPAHIAAKNGDQAMLRLLLTPLDPDNVSESLSENDRIHDTDISDLPINTQDDNGQTFLMLAAYRGHRKIFQTLLLQEDLLFDLVDTSKRNFLHYLCGESNFDDTVQAMDNRREILENYFEHLGEDSEEFFRLLASKDADNKTPLDYAYSESGDPQLIEMLEEKIAENLDSLIENSKASDNANGKSALTEWYESLKKGFEKGGLSNKKRENNDRLQKLAYHTEVMQNKLAEDPDDLTPIDEWVKNTEKDLYTQKLRDRWKMLLLTFLCIALFGALGFGITLVSLKAQVWMMAKSLSAITNNMWVSPGFETQLISSVSAASTVVGAAVGLIISRFAFFGEKRNADRLILEARDTNSLKLGSHGAGD